MSELAILNKITGEIKDLKEGDKLISKTQSDSFIIARRMTEDNKIFVEEYGNFIFKADSKQVSRIDNKISGSDISKLIYCATYLDYDNILHFDNGKPILKRELKDVINVNKNIFYKWYNLMIKEKILTENEDCTISMSKKYCIKGKLSKNTEYNRIFINAMRKIYEDNTTKSSKTLGLIMSILPHINSDTNILCWNPNESDTDKQSPITVNELMNIYGFNSANTRQFINQISKFRVYDGQPIMLFFNDNEYLNDNYIMFNPKLTYSGKNENLPETYKMFVLLANKENSKNKGKKRLQSSDTNGLR